jgi:hypothetical protein
MDMYHTFTNLVTKQISRVDHYSETNTRLGSCHGIVEAPQNIAEAIDYLPDLSDFLLASFEQYPSSEEMHPLRRV